MAPRRGPLHGVNVQRAWLGAGQPLCDQQRQGSPSTAGTCGFKCGHHTGGGREKEGNRGPAEDRGLCSQGLHTARSGDQGGPTGSAD